MDARHKAGHDGDTMTSFMGLALEEAGQPVVAARFRSAASSCATAKWWRSAGNRTLADHDPTAYAEIVAIRSACAAFGSERLSDCDLYVTLEPCAMCAGAVAFARIRRLYYGAPDPKGGAVDNGVKFFASPSCHHRPEVYGGLAEAEASALLKSFFQEKR